MLVVLTLKIKACKYDDIDKDFITRQNSFIYLTPVNFCIDNAGIMWFIFL